MLRNCKERSQLGNFQNKINMVLGCWHTLNLFLIKKRKCNYPKCVVDKKRFWILDEDTLKLNQVNKRIKINIMLIHFKIRK